MNLSCSCGARFKSMGAEARHRHNFPILCRMKNRRYYGVNIYRNVEPGKLRWYTVAPCFAADTLAEIKSLIKDAMP